MSEKEKVMTVTLMRSDLCDSSAYFGVELTLPADSGEIHDALHRARVTDNQPYQVVKCLSMQGETLDFIPDNAPLTELNYLAYQFSRLNEQDRLAFVNCAAIDDRYSTMKELLRGQPGLYGECNLALKNECLYPYEMPLAAEHFQNNDNPEKISDLIQSGDLEPASAFFPKIGNGGKNDGPNVSIGWSILRV